MTDDDRIKRGVRLIRHEACATARLSHDAYYYPTDTTAPCAPREGYCPACRTKRSARPK